MSRAGLRSIEKSEKLEQPKEDSPTQLLRTPLRPLLRAGALVAVVPAAARRAGDRHRPASQPRRSLPPAAASCAAAVQPTQRPEQLFDA